MKIAMVSGWVIGRLGMEKHVEEWVYAAPGGGDGAEIVYRPNWRDRIDYGLDAVRDIVGKVWPYVLAGIAVGGFRGDRRRRDPARRNPVQCSVVRGWEGPKPWRKERSTTSCSCARGIPLEASSPSRS